MSLPRNMTLRVVPFCDSFKLVRQQRFDLIISIGTVGVELSVENFQTVINLFYSKGDKVFHFDFSDADSDNNEFEFECDAPTLADVSKVRELVKWIPDGGAVLVHAFDNAEARTRASAVATIILEELGLTRKQCEELPALSGTKPNPFLLSLSLSQER